MPKFLPCIAAACLSLAPQMSLAEVDLDDLRTRSAEANTEMDQLREILSSSRPDQAMRALQIVMKEGSVEQKRIALEASLASTSKAVRRTGMEAFLHTKPIIAYKFDGSKIKGSNDAINFERYIQQSGSVDENRQGRFAYKVGEYSAEKSCWVWATYEAACMISVTDENVIIYLSRGTLAGIGSIGTDGIVRGNVKIPKSATVPYEFVVKF